MNIDYDVIVGGGSIVGLLDARQIAAAGVAVLVLEDHPEIGIPEKCDGLIGSGGLEALGIMPRLSMIQNHINGAILHSPSGKLIEIDSSNMGVLVVDRSKLDLGVAHAAVKHGAEIRTVFLGCDGIEFPYGAGREGANFSGCKVRYRWRLVSDRPGRIVL